MRNSGEVGFARLLSSVAVLTLIAVASCGGESVRHEAQAGEAGESGAGKGGAPIATGGSDVAAGRGGNSAGTTASSGSAGTASSVGGTGSVAGTSSVGGTSTVAGSSSVGGTSSVAGTTGTGGCDVIPPCLPPVCGDDATLVDVPCGCPYCSCEDVNCAAVDCGPGTKPSRPDGACCETCVPVDESCNAVTCEPREECETGRSWRYEPGACCAACLPLEPPGCPEIACNPNLECPTGYAAGDGTNGCCSECVPDPLYCVDDGDCLIATKPSGCCYCPEVISRRKYEEESCWILPDGTISPECMGGVTCDVVCGGCPDIGDARCENERCVAIVPTDN